MRGTLWHSLLCPHLCLIKHQPAAINTRLHTETQCTHIGVHGLDPLCILHHLWLECLRRNVGKCVIYPSIHLRLHSSLLPPSPLPFIMKKKSIFQFRITCAEISHTLLPIILTETLMRRGFRLFHWPIYKPWLQYDLFYPPTHMEVRWKADCNFYFWEVNLLFEIKMYFNGKILEKEIWVRCLDHLNWLLSVWRSSGSTQILFQVTELFILSPRNRPATLWRKSLISTTCICNVLLSARACDNRWR